MVNKSGDCIKIAADFVIERPGFVFCHGLVSGQGPLRGRRFRHAWVERNGLVFDFSNSKQVIMPVERYYSIGKIKKVTRFSADEVGRLMLKTEKYDFWKKGDLR